MAVTPVTPGARARLAAAMEARRLELGLTWQEVAIRGGTSTKTLQVARTGPHETRADTKRAIERGLSWDAGSVDMILQDREPVPLDAPAAAPDADGPGDTAAAMFPDDPVAAEIWRRDLPVEEREREIAGWRQVQADGAVDRVAGLIWLESHRDREDRLREIRDWRKFRREQREEAGLLRSSIS